MTRIGARLTSPMSLLFSLLVLLPAQALRAAGPDPVYLGVLVGSTVYQGREGLQDLKYADDDVLRFARAIRPLIDPAGLELLVDPDPDVAAGLRAVGLERWSRPDGPGLKRQLERVEARTKALRQEEPGVEVRVILFISAHGDALGVHLADGIFTGPSLQSSLDGLSADSVLLVADACFSSQWLALKGVSSPAAADVEAFPLDAVAGAVRDLERVGAVAAQSATREEHAVVHGGLLTHVVSSGLIGAADLDGDEVILYEEMRAWLGAYGRSSDLLKRVRVQAPRRSPETPPVLVHLRRLERGGLSFPTRRPGVVERYLVRDGAGRLVAELCRRSDERRKLYLPPGRYAVQRFSPPDAWFGEEGTLEVRDGFTPVLPERLEGWWKWPGAKGSGEDDGIDGALPAPAVASARTISLEETSYRALSPFRRPVGWRDLPRRVQLSFQLGVEVPYPMAAWGDAGDPALSLTAEQPFGRASIQVDRRWLRLGMGYLDPGMGLELGLSPGNRVGALEGVSVYRLGYLPRLGYELSRGRWTGRAALSAGAMSAAPGFDPALAAYWLPLGGLGRFELSVAVRTRGGAWIEAGGGASLTVEPQDFGPAVGQRWVPYRGLTMFTGLQW